MYMLHSLTKINGKKWELIVWRPDGNLDEMKWETTASIPELQDRALRLVDRRNVEYYDLRKGKTGHKAVSHWRAMASIAIATQSTERIKQWEHERIEQFRRMKA